MSAVFRLVLRTQLTRGRAAGLGVVALVGVALAVAVRASEMGAGADAAHDLVDDYGLGLLTPVTALVFSSAALGDPAEDATLVYLWLRPLSRWRLALGALAASWVAAVPLAAAPMALAAVVAGGGGRLALATATATVVAASAYSAVFLGLGLLVRRALAWGLAYLLIWEGFVARSGTGVARLSVLTYARSLLSHLSGQDPPPLAASPAVAVVVPVLVVLVAFALSIWALERVEVA